MTSVPLKSQSCTVHVPETLIEVFRRWLRWPPRGSGWVPHELFSGQRVWMERHLP